MKRFKKILLDIGTVPGGGAALRRATILARRNDATLTVVAVVPDVPRRTRLAPIGLEALLSEDHDERLAAALAELRDADLRVVSKMLKGDHAVEVIREVIRGGHDLVLRSHTASVPYGPIDMKLLRKCPCHVWLVAGRAAASPRKILAAVKPSPDDSSTNALNATVLELATSLAEAEGGEVLVVHGWSMFGEGILRRRLSTDELEKLVDEARSDAKRELDELLEPFASRIHEDHVHLVKGLPGAVIPAFVAAHQIDLLIMGTLARSGVAGVITGNTAEQVLGEVHCSLIALKPPGFVSPITL